MKLVTMFFQATKAPKLTLFSRLKTIKRLK
nr:MAG TPA: hypothetical protein [Caudoviricetes sp.]